MLQRMLRREFVGMGSVSGVLGVGFMMGLSLSLMSNSCSGQMMSYRRS
jgi:hypothetical protein